MNVLENMCINTAKSNGLLAFSFLSIFAGLTILMLFAGSYCSYLFN